VGLSDFADFYPNELSGGMRKRAGLARAIISQPRILLCDEPTSGLDPITAARMDDLLLSMHRRFPGMTIVSVSHDLASLNRIADYVLVLRDGACVFAGTPGALRESSDPYLVRFLNRDGGDDDAAGGEGADPAVQASLDRWLAS
jgi:phospholipid/cholesterol/gamma-HCH transport system ATP-binding protein